MTTVVTLAEDADGREAFLEVDKGTEKTIRFVSESSDFLVSRSENSLWDCFSWLRGLVDEWITLSAELSGLRLREKRRAA